MCCHYQVFGAIFAGCIDVCLVKKEGRFGGEAGARCLPSAGNQAEGLEKVEPVLFGGLLWLGVNSLVVIMWKSVRDGLIGKVELDMWVAMAGI